MLSPMYNYGVKEISYDVLKIRNEKPVFLMMNVETFIRGGICSYWFYRY